MLTIIRKVILDNLMQKEIEFTIRTRKIQSLFANRKWNFCACALIFILRGWSRTQLLVLFENQVTLTLRNGV